MADKPWEFNTSAFQDSNTTTGAQTANTGASWVDKYGDPQNDIMKKLMSGNGVMDPMGGVQQQSAFGSVGGTPMLGSEGWLSPLVSGVGALGSYLNTKDYNDNQAKVSQYSMDANDRAEKRHTDFLASWGTGGGTNASSVAAPQKAAVPTYA